MRTWTLATLPVLAIACSSSYSAEPTAPTDAGADATTDAGVGTEAGTDDSGDGGYAGTNVLANGDFGLGCAAWSTSNDATADELTTEGNIEPGSCKLCSAASTPNGTLTQSAQGEAAGGQEWLGEIWVRAAPGVSAPTAKMYLEVYDAADTYMAGTPAVSTSFGTVWKRFRSIITVPAGGTTLSFNVVVDDPAKCVLLDDAVLVRIK